MANSARLHHHPELRAKVMNEGLPLFSHESIIGDTGSAPKRSANPSRRMKPAVDA